MENKENQQQDISQQLVEESVGEFKTTPPRMLLLPRQKPKSVTQWVALSLQHVFAMFGANVLVPIIINSTANAHVINTAMALFASGLGTLIYIALTAAKVPIYLGSSFAYMTVVGTGYADWGNAVFIAIFLVGVVYILVGLLIHFTSNKWLIKLFSPIVVGPIIITIGLGAIPSGLKDAGIIYDHASLVSSSTDYPQWLAILIAVVVIATAAIFMLKAKSFFKVLPILAALIVGYVLCVIIQLADPNIKLMNFDFITKVDQWEWYPNFKNVFNVKESNVGPAIVAIVPIAFVTMVEHYGDHVNLGNMTGNDFVKDPGIGRTLFADGASIAVTGLMGGPANTTYAENTSVVGITKVASVYVTGLAAVFAIIMAFLAPINQMVQMIPKPVLGGISIMLFGIIATNGIRVMIDAKVELGNAKNLLVIGLTLGLGVGMTISGATIDLGQFQLTGLFLAAVVGVITNLIMPNQINDGIFNAKWIVWIKQKIRKQK